MAAQAAETQTSAPSSSSIPIQRQRPNRRRSSSSRSAESSAHGKHAISKIPVVDYTYVLPDSSISEWLKCPICLAPFVDPVSPPGCEHVFCRPCVTRHIERQIAVSDGTSMAPSTSSSSSVSQSPSQSRLLRGHDSGINAPGASTQHIGSCPACRSRITSSLLQPAPMLIRNMVDTLLVKCFHSDRGCTHMCERSLVHNHARHDCGFAFVAEYGSEDEEQSKEASCNGKAIMRRNISKTGRCECGKRVLVRDLDEHRSSGNCCATFIRCPHAGDDTLHCEALLRDTELDAHLDLCDARPVSCSSCGLNLLQGRLQDHNGQCAEKIVACPFERFGCSWQGKRGDLGEKSTSGKIAAGHLQRCALAPLEVFLFGNEARMAELEEDNRRLKGKLCDVQKDNLILKTSLEACIKTIGPISTREELEASTVSPLTLLSQMNQEVETRSDQENIGRDVPRGRSQSTLQPPVMTASASSVSSPGGIAFGPASAPATSDEQPWQWPRPLLSADEPVHASVASAVGPRIGARRDQPSLTTSMLDLQEQLRSLTTQMKSMERHLDEAHVVSHSAAFEAQRAHDDLNNVRHGVHSLRLQMHSLLMMQQQQQQHHRGLPTGSSAGATTNIPGSSSATGPGGSGMADYSGSSPGLMPPSMIPYGPAGPPMMGMRRFWAGFEQTKL